jgi:predicted XRE-type DNA-binding protein
MSHNVWADMGFPDAEEMQRKCDISIEIERIMDRAGFSKRKAAAAIGVSPSQLTAILDADIQQLDRTVLEGYRDRLKGLTT